MVRVTERPKSVNTEQAAVLIGIPPASVRRLIRIGQIKAVQLGRYYVIPVEEIDRLLEPARQARKDEDVDDLAQRRSA